MLASKAGAKRISLKLVFKDDLPAGGLMFTFTSATAEADRETVKNQLIPYVTVHRNGPDAGTTGTGTPGTPASGPAAGSSKPSTATAAVVSQVGAAAGVGDGMPNTAKRRKLDGGAIDSPGAGPSTPGTPGAMTPEQQAARKLETKLKMKVLAKNPNLRALHKELVRGAQISEKEFWEGREVRSRSASRGLFADRLFMS
jgi:transcription initiation factor TFIIH subunit 1